jgi:hypothetical protein
MCDGESRTARMGDYDCAFREGSHAKHGRLDRASDSEFAVMYFDAKPAKI